MLKLLMLFLSFKPPRKDRQKHRQGRKVTTVTSGFLASSEIDVCLPLNTWLLLDVADWTPTLPKPPLSLGALHQLATRQLALLSENCSVCFADVRHERIHTKRGSYVKMQAAEEEDVDDLATLEVLDEVRIPFHSELSGASALPRAKHPPFKTVNSAVIPVTRAASASF